MAMFPRKGLLSRKEDLQEEIVNGKKRIVYLRMCKMIYLISTELPVRLK